MSQEVSEEAVGCRVCCDGERGTVCYIGAVPPTAGTSLIIHVYIITARVLIKVL